jgi:YVTN family beta-propeller protein
VTNEGSNDLTIVDLATGNTRSVPVGKAPRKIAVQQSERRAETVAPRNVRIVEFAFSPESIVVAPGGRVTWRNDDGAIHAIAFAEGSEGAKSLAPGEAFSRTFAASGDYAYFCAFHPYMTGAISVKAGS